MVLVIELKFTHILTFRALTLGTVLNNEIFHRVLAVLAVIERLHVGGKN